MKTKGKTPEEYPNYFLHITHVPFHVYTMWLNIKIATQMNVWYKNKKSHFLRAHLTFDFHYIFIKAKKFYNKK